MRFFIRLFMFLLIIGAAAYGYAWYKNKQAVDQMINKAGGSYDSTYIDVNGDSVTTGISIPVAFFDSTYQIDEFRVGAGDPITFFKVIRSFQNQDLSSLPDHLTLYAKTRGEKIPVTKKLNEISKTMSEISLFNLPFAGCGDTKFLTSADYYENKINNFISDSNLTLTYSKADKRGYLDIYSNMKDVQTLKASLNLTNFSFNNLPASKISQGSIELSDNGIQRIVNSICANNSQLTEKQFTERHISYLKHQLYFDDIYLSPEFYEEYSKYHSNPRTIKATFHPDKAFQPMSLMGATPRRLMSLLNADIKINDKSILPLFGNRPDPSELPQLDEVTAERSTLRTVQGLTVQATSVSNIARYVGYDAYFSYRGQKYKGQIMSVGNGNAIIRYEINAGNHIAKPFLMSDITRLRIRREYIPQVKAAND